MSQGTWTFRDQSSTPNTDLSTSSGPTDPVEPPARRIRLSACVAASGRGRATAARSPESGNDSPRIHESYRMDAGDDVIDEEGEESESELRPDGTVGYFQS